MAVTVTATRVWQYSPNSYEWPVYPGTKPPGPDGWNNQWGDENWTPDIYYRTRFDLVCEGPEVGTVVNWEICRSDIVPFKTAAEISATTAGTTASPFGALVNNSTTWTIWASTGSAAAGTAKYTDTKTRCISTLRANGPRVQVVMPPSQDVFWHEEYKVAAFLPGSFGIPSGTASLVVKGSNASESIPPWIGYADDPAVLPTVGEPLPDTTPPPVEPEPEPETPPEGTIQEVLAWVGDDLDRAFDAYESEMAREHPRSTLMEALQKILD